MGDLWRLVEVSRRLGHDLVLVILDHDGGIKSCQYFLREDTVIREFIITVVGTANLSSSDKHLNTAKSGAHICVCCPIGFALFTRLLPHSAACADFGGRRCSTLRRKRPV
jgi:hypothetical protein